MQIPFLTPGGSDSGQMTNLRAASEVPVPYDQLFDFPYFNLVQSAAFEDALKTEKGLVVSAPTGSGKTAIFELAIIRELVIRGAASLMVYLAPIKALCSERFLDWSRKFDGLKGKFHSDFSTV